MKITVTGSLGHISKPLTQELIQKGHSVTVVSSKAERQKEIETLGAQAAIGTMQDADFLTRAFTGADVVYCMHASDRSMLFDPNFTFTEMVSGINQVFLNYKQAILRSGVKQIIHLSSIGAHTDKGNGLLKSHYYAEKVLSELPAAVHIKTMRPAGFYYNLLPFADVIKQLSKGLVGAFMSMRYYGLSGLLGGKSGVVVSNAGDKDVALLVSTNDIASTIAEEVESPFNGRTVRYIASEELSCNEVATILGHAIGKPYLKWGQISDKQLLNALTGLKWSPTIAQAFVEMQAGMRGANCVVYEDYYRHRPVLSKTKLKDYAKEFAEEYNKQI